MSKKSRLRAITLRRPKKVAMRRPARQSTEHMGGGWVDDTDLTPKANDDLVPKLPEPQETEMPRTQADRDADDTQRLIKKAGGDLDAFYQSTAKAQISKYRLAKKNYYLKTFDIWEAPLDEASTRNNHSPNDKMVQRDNSSNTQDLLKDNAPALPLPGTAISYNPTVQAQQHAIKAEAKRILREDKILSIARTICGPSEGYGATLQDDREVQLLNTFQDRASKEQEPLITTCQDISHEAPPPKPCLPGLENVIYGEALKIDLTTETAQALLDGRLLQKRATLADRKAMRKTVGELKCKLGNLENEIRLLEEAEKYAELRAQQSTRTPTATSTKRKKQLSSRVQEEDIPVLLPEDCSGSLRLTKPIGSIAESLLLNAQRRNLVEVTYAQKPMPHKKREYIIY